MRGILPFGLLFSALIAIQGCAPLQSEDTAKLPRSAVEQQLSSSDPSNYYVYAARLFHEGAKEDAVFWFYVGEIRYRFYLAANPTLDPSGAPALFNSLHEEVGSVVNGWAGADPDSWAKQMGRALAWDATNDNKFTSKATYAKQWQDARLGLEKLKEEEVANKAQILEERKKRGL